MFIKHLLTALLFLANFNAEASGVDAYTFIDKDTLDVNFQCEEIALPQKMPRVRNQAGSPICYAYSSALIIQYQFCKRSNIKDCDTVEPKLEVSPLSTMNKSFEDLRGVLSPKKLEFFESSSGAFGVLKRTERSFVFLADSCFPIDDFNKRFGANSGKEWENILASIKNEMKKSKAGKPVCDTCIQKIVKKLGTKVTAEKIKSSIIKYAHTFDQANNEYYTEKHVLYDATIGGCHDVVSLRFSNAPKAAEFPIQTQDVSYEKIIGKVKEVLSTGNPIAFEGICAVSNGNKCRIWHSVVIYGYKKICSTNSCDKNCRDIVQVQNSWGEEWQRESNNGLLDAKTLFLDMLKYKDKSLRALSWLY